MTIHKTKAFNNRIAQSLIAFMLAFSCNALSHENTSSQNDTCSQTQRYIFAWQFVNKPCELEPRGGTSTGKTTTVDSNPSKHWRTLQSPNLSKYERDRQAILAMSGYFRVGFDFMETMGFTEAYSPSAPYRSWGTELVVVAENKPDFISLQHIMVMYFVDEEGNVSEPMVMKHWRQDWQFEKDYEFVYSGNNIWQRKALPASDIAGTWSQSVFQVDDSPRYESQGKWQHYGNRSEWISKVTWRPLPRRESSVRKDYHVLEGINKHIILPTGWVQEEENFKLVLGEQAQPLSTTPYLAKEFGIARYERIKEHDFTPGEAYWRKTASFWRSVRHVWTSLIEENTRIEINKQVNGNFMFMPFFEYAQSVADGGSDKTTSEEAKIKDILRPFIRTLPNNKEP